MKTMKLILLAGSAVAVSGAVAQADELSDLKAQVEALNARVAAMETAPSVPNGYQLLAISKGEPLQVPGLGGSDRDRVINDRATIISVLPTADAPAGTTISWSGYVRAAIVYAGEDQSAKFKRSYDDGAGGGFKTSAKISVDNDDDWDVKARGQLKVVATTDTAVGEVGVLLKMRANFNGNGTGNLYGEEMWGYWAMTPELTLGGGYSKSLANILYGYDGACTCYYTDNADVNFDPGDVSQMRLSYTSGPFSMAVAIEDSGLNNKYGNDNNYYNGQNLGVAGRLQYSGDVFSGEISGVYRSINDGDYDLSGSSDANGFLLSKTDYSYEANIDALWQVGIGMSFGMGDVASLSLAAALGQGPFEEVNSSGDITAAYPVQNSWWGVSGLATVNMTDAFFAEFGAGYKHREGDSHKGADFGSGPLWKYSGFDYDTWALLGGLYYQPVDQLTIGLEAEWYTEETDVSRKGIVGTATEGYKESENYTSDNWTVDLVSVWRF